MKIQSHYKGIDGGITSEMKPFSLAKPRSDYKILIIDQDEISSKIHKELFNRIGFEPILADSVNHASKIFFNFSNLDLLLFDMDILEEYPMLSYNVLFLKIHNESVPLIGFTLDPDIIIPNYPNLKSSLCNILIKPITIEVLEHYVTKHLHEGEKTQIL